MSVSSTSQISLCLIVSKYSSPFVFLKFQWLVILTHAPISKPSGRWNVFKTLNKGPGQLRIFPEITPIPVFSDLPSVASPLTLSVPPFPYTPSLSVLPSFHSCPHILGSPVLSSRISPWNLMHLFPSLPGKRRLWRHEGKTQRKYRATQRGITMNLRATVKKMKKLKINMPTVWCSYTMSMWLPALSISSPLSSWLVRGLRSCCWVHLYLFLHCNVSILLFPLFYFMLADTLASGLYWIWITSSLLKNRGDQCGVQVRP